MGNNQGRNVYGHGFWKFETYTNHRNEVISHMAINLKYTTNFLHNAGKLARIPSSFVNFHLNQLIRSNIINLDIKRQPLNKTIRRSRASTSLFHRIRTVIGNRSECVSVHNSVGPRSTNLIPLNTASAHQCESSKSYRISHINARSIMNKIPQFHQCILDGNIDICAITKTWVREDDEFNGREVAPDSYKIFSQPRKGNARGGSVGIIAQSNITTDIVSNTDLTFLTMETIVCRLKLNNHPTDFQVIYRIPGTSVLEFCSEFMDSIECNIMTTHNKPLLLGDFNIHIDHTDHHKTGTFLDMLDSLNLRNWVVFPTHLSGHTLDLVLDDIDSPIVTSVTKGHMMSDHFFTDCMITVTSTEPMKPTTIKTRKLKAIDMSAFKSDIANITLKSTDLHGMVMQYNMHLQELLNTHAPEVEIMVCKRKMQSWFSDKIRQEIQVWRAKERKWLKDPTNYNLPAFYNQRHFFSNIIRKAQKDHYHSILEDNKSHFKVVFKITSSLLFCTDPSPLPPMKNSKTLVDEFNQFLRTKYRKSWIILHQLKITWLINNI